MSTDAVSQKESKPNRMGVAVRHALFGKQNERIEFVMDSYFKLSPEGRAGVLAGGVIALLLGLGMTIVLYLVALNRLQTSLDNGFEAVNKLREAKIGYLAARQSVSDLESRLSSAQSGVSLASTIEQIAKDKGVQATGFPPQDPVSELSPTHPLVERWQQAKVTFRIEKISLRKIIDLMVALESSPAMLKVSSFKVQQNFNDKLYFNVNMEVEGLVKKR